MPSRSGSMAPMSPPAAEYKVGNQSVICTKSDDTLADCTKRGLQIKAVPRMPVKLQIDSCLLISEDKHPSYNIGLVTYWDERCLSLN